MMTPETRDVAAMSEPRAILLVTAELASSTGTPGLRGPLLARGPLDSMPPRIRRCQTWTGWSEWGGSPLAWNGGEVQCAIPLLWDAAVVPEGWDRARRVCAELPRDQRPTGPLWGWLHDFHPTRDGVLVLARFLEAAGLCRVVLLDLVDGQLRERAP